MYYISTVSIFCQLIKKIEYQAYLSIGVKEYYKLWFRPLEFI